MYLKEAIDPKRVRAVIDIPALSDNWRADLEKRLAV
jgi:hypothetical protein